MWSKPSCWDSWAHWVETASRRVALDRGRSLEQGRSRTVQQLHDGLDGQKHAMRDDPKGMRQMTQDACLISASSA